MTLKQINVLEEKYGKFGPLRYLLIYQNLVKNVGFILVVLMNVLLFVGYNAEKDRDQKNVIHNVKIFELSESSSTALLHILGVIILVFDIIIVLEFITKDAVLEKIVAMNDSLRMDFGCTKPKIAVLALNSEFGDEEKNTISQAVEEAKSSGFIVSGPFLSETFFDAAEYTRFDGVIGMYRDQVVGPFKALAFDNSISYSLGFPKICVSPALTVNYDQVDKNITEESPLAMAIFAASDLLEKREQYTELTKNQLK